MTVCLSHICLYVHTRTYVSYTYLLYSVYIYTATIGMNEFSKYGFTVPECYYYDSVENYLSTSFLDGKYICLLLLYYSFYIYPTYYILHTILYIYIVLYMCYIFILHSIHTPYIILYMVILLFMIRV